MKEMKPVAEAAGNPFRDNPYYTMSNLDNIPSHMYKDENGKEHWYAFASKNWSLTDPDVRDPKSLHYASANKVYLVLKNKYTKEWEFPTGSIYFGESFYKARNNLFEKFAKDWTCGNVSRSPFLHTIWDLTDAEIEQPINKNYRGVRTYYFLSCHRRGVPMFKFENTDWEDWAWVPKLEINKYFTKERFDLFINSLQHY